MKRPARSRPYLDAAQVLLRESGCIVRRYRTSVTGVASVRSDDWEIEAPEPLGPVSFAVLAHEIGHQLLHRTRNRPRWLEELEAWEYALKQFERFDLKGIDRARHSAKKSLVYAAIKAARRGNAKTAQTILDRYPSWVWDGDAPDIMVVGELVACAKGTP